MWRGQPAIKGGTLGGHYRKAGESKASNYGPTPEPKTRLGFRDLQPGNVHERETDRASRYSNPPSSVGLNGLQLDSDVNKRRGYCRNGVVGVTKNMGGSLARKGEPF